MVGIHHFRIMMNFNLISELEDISLRYPERVLKIIGYVEKKGTKEYLEIIIFKGFSSSTTHPIEFDPDERVLKEKCCFLSCQLFIAPLNSNDDIFKESKDLEFFLDEDQWV